MKPRWNTAAELSALILAKASAGRRVELSPDTAYRVALWLRRVEAIPTRDEVALMICGRIGRGESCPHESSCFNCLGRANIVVAAYGHKPAL